MINRQYVVKMPSSPTMPLDITLRGPVGSATAPVCTGTTRTDPPAGWVGGDGAFYEWRARPVPFPVTASQAAAGFVPRGRLGVSVGMVEIATAATGSLPAVLLSQSIVNTLDAGNGVINPVDLADPAYGPVIRLGNSTNTVNKTLLVSVSFFEAKDEDRDPTGI